MLAEIKTFFSKHFSQHILLYFLVLLFFSIGIAAGAFSVKALSDIQKNKLMDYLAASIKFIFVDGNINNLQILIYSALNNLKLVLIIWLLSISVIAFPLIYLVIGIRGFVLGFTTGFLAENMGYKGILLATVSILPQNFIFIPVLIFLSVFSISYSMETIKNRNSNRYEKNDKFYNLLKYSLACIIVCIILLAGSLVEGYISPIFLKGVSQYIIN